MERYRIALVHEFAGALMPRRRRRRTPWEDPERQESAARRQEGMRALAWALESLARRGPGPQGWAPVHEDPLAFLLDTMSDALFVRDAQGNILFANAAARQLLASDPPSLSGRDFPLDFPEQTLTLTLVSFERSSPWT